MDISVVIPVYGCRAALTELYRRLVESVSKITTQRVCDVYTLVRIPPDNN